ncbi:MAG: transcription antitermination factor NusB, partial [Alphaproteobacteria bacterium]|nr:transcription antitermination factor NusB [Alphaproteobacteria bacterium]
TVAKSLGVFSKRLARTLAVQFMYQLQMKDIQSVSDIEVDDFINTYANDNVNTKFFKKLVANFQKCTHLDEMIESVLEDGKTVLNSPPVEICIIKTALTEMIFEKTDIPVIINEYVEIAKDFLDEKSAKFINALLDKISKKVERKCLKEA